MSNNRKPVIGIVVPCLNEELILEESAKKLCSKVESLIHLDKIDSASKIYFVDDGSTDETWRAITMLVQSSERFVGVKLTRNYGHQYALYAGLMQATGDALISIDADLQDDIGAIEEMVAKFVEGNEIVYGVRNDRTADGKFKRWTAVMHYWLARKFGIQSIPNHADFRLMSKRAIALLGEYRETNIYLRGIIPLIGLKSANVYYARGPRLAGESKYGLRAMLGLSVQGMTSFSIVPLRLISLLGTTVFLISTGLGIWALQAKLMGNSTAIDGWASTVIPIYLLGGLQLLAIGVAGEYIGKMYMEVKKRPKYLIEDVATHQSDFEIETE
jgi:glycosyltransferase involved in cell wall biosynthesis